MKWTRIRIKTITDAEDIIISDLYDIGLEGAQIEDKIPLSPLEKEQMFVDILPNVEPDDGIAYLSFFVEEGTADIDELVAKVKDVLADISSYCDIGEGSVTIDETEDLDWINNWKKYFHQFYIDDLLVIPSWEEVKDEDKDKKILHIDPGTAFGTGMHETTQLCIRALRKYMTPGARVLDVGTGSGVLSILAMKFGAGHTVGTDLDPCAEPAVADNKKANDVAVEDFDLIIGNIIDDDKVKEQVGTGYDIVVANILPYVLVPLTPIVPGLLKDGGIYITSGIIEAKEEVIRKAHEDAGLNVIEICKQGEWVSVISRK